ncbi:MAG: hypothetical protein ACRCYO_09335 [Bacteroidia bacterium]
MKFIASSHTLRHFLGANAVAFSLQEENMLSVCGKYLVYRSSKMAIEAKGDFDFFATKIELSRLEKILALLPDQPITVIWSGTTLSIQNIDVF